MRLPKSVPLFGYDHKVELSDESSYSFAKKLIQVDKTADCLEAELLHEIVHGILAISGHAYKWPEVDDGNERGEEESIVRALENGLYPIYGLKKNKNVKYK
jgi:ssRNA-specific RNase YbeY (16S rRNA maturation enzyme)